MKLLKDERFHDQGLHNFDSNLDQPRHRWYHFKEGFSADLVQQAVDSLGGTDPNDMVVLDPFAGSGTTPLSARLAGHRSYAIEVNPFCAFTTKVKCNTVVPNERKFWVHLDSLALRAEKAKCHSPLEGQSTFTKTKGIDKWLFNKPVLRAFQSVVSDIGPMTFSFRSAFKLAAIRAAMECCNAKKDGKALRYHRDWEDRNYSAKDFVRCFRAAAMQFREDAELAPVDPGKPCVLASGDSRRSLQKLRTRSVDALVTSPPYLNSFDYSDVYRPELFLGGFVHNNTDLRRIRLRTLRSHVQVDWKGKIHVKSSLLAGPLNELRQADGLWSARIPEMVEAYFHDMNLILNEAFRVLKKGGTAWIVVSTSAYGGVHIPVDLILADLGSNVGFELGGVFLLRSLRVAGQQQSCFTAGGLPLRESLIILNR